MDTLSKINLEKMTKAELVVYANMTYGLNVNSNLDKYSLIDNIQRAALKFAGNVELTIEDENVLKPGYSRIKINKTETNKNGRPVIVSLQGKAASLPVGIEITVPNSYVEILNNAVQYRYEADPANDNELVRQEVHSYPFSILETAAALPK